MIVRLHTPSHPGAVPASIDLPLPPGTGTVMVREGKTWIVSRTALALDGETSADVWLREPSDEEA